MSRTVLAACAVVALVLAALLVVAARGPADVRPVGIGSSSTDHVAYCVGDAGDGDRSTEWAVAVTIENRSTSPAHVVALRPDTTTGLRDVEAWVRPVGDPHAVGGGVVGRIADFREGHRLRPAVGATLGPHERRWLVVGMRVEDQDGGMASGWSVATAGPFGTVRSQPLDLDLGVTGAVTGCTVR